MAAEHSATMTESHGETDEAWSTDEDLRAARLRFVERLPGYEQPVAYGVGRLDDGELVLGHVNRPGGQHLLPAVVLASVCGHSSGTATHVLTADQMAEAVARLAPAEAATHWDHPNLWSWRSLVNGGSSDSTYVVFFVQNLDDPAVNEHDLRFRERIEAD